MNSTSVKDGMVNRLVFRLNVKHSTGNWCVAFVYDLTSVIKHLKRNHPQTFFFTANVVKSKTWIS